MTVDNIPPNKQPISQKLGSASLILGIVTGMGSCLLTPFSATIALGGGDIGVTFMLITIICIQSIVGLLNIGGVILGILALAKKDAGKGKAIAGVILNGFFVCISITILWNAIPFLAKLIN